jgi:anaerobic magnesium-protoporphyrin IX monomethyl ester cyclase
VKILLLSVNSHTFFYDQLVIPFGLASLGSYVQDDGHIIKGIEMNTPPEMIPHRYLNVDRQLLEEITQYAPDLVAMTAYAENIHNILFWAEKIKQKLPETTIAVGGNHASYIAREILGKCPAVDVVVRFEGEIPFKELCHKVEKNDRNYDDIPSATYRKSGEIVENELVGLIPDLDALPLINRDFFESHQSSTMSHADIITARGCPFHCTFCDCNHYWGKKYRTMSTRRAVEELRSLKNRYPDLRTVRFRDESISINKKRCLELCNLLIENDLGLKLQAHSRLDGLDEEVIKHLARAGFNQLYIGLESGSQAVLDRLRKGIDINKVYELVPLLRKYGISFRFSLILATPGESMEEAIKTIQLVEDLDLSFDEFYFGVGLIIYPGTSDCERFFIKYPDYKWLYRNDLKDGYRERLDHKGNVVAVTYIAPEYDLNALYEEINKGLQHKLNRYGETNYFLFRSSEAAVRRITRHFSHKKDAIYNIIAELAKALDRRGTRWGIFRKGLYYSEIFSDVCEKGDLRNFAGVFSPQDEAEKGGSTVRRELEGVKYLVLAITEREATSHDTLHFLDRWRFRGEILLVDKFLKREDCLEQLYDHDVDEVVAGIRLGPGSYYRARYRAKVVRVLKAIRLYKVAKKFKTLIRVV